MGLGFSFGIAGLVLGGIILAIAVFTGMLPTALPGVGLSLFGLTLLLAPNLTIVAVVSGLAIILGLVLYAKGSGARMVSTSPLIWGALGLSAWAYLSGLL